MYQMGIRIHLTQKSGPVVFCGDGSEKFIQVCEHSNKRYLEIDASAQWMCVLAEEAFKQNSFEDVAYFEPFYLKDFVAGKPKKLL